VTWLLPLTLCACGKENRSRHADQFPEKVEKSAGAAVGRDHNKPIAGDDLFASLRVIQLGLEIAPRRLDALKKNKDSHSYVRCTVLEGGRSLADVGVHCKGNPAKEFASGKPDFTVTFDKFVSKQEFHGLRRLTLQSSRDDPSYLATPIALEMFRQAGVPAPRCGFARVELNGRDLGLYLLVEGVNSDFLRRHFSKSNGNLYDEGDHTDVTGKLDKDAGADRDDQSDVDALAAAARQTDPDKRWRLLQQRLDMERFLAFTAMEVLLWQDDSYALEARKFRIYHDPVTDRMVFFPKGVERVFEKTDGPLLPECKGVVAKAVLTTPAGQKQYRETVAKLLDTVFQPAKVQARVQELVAAIRSAAVGSNASTAAAFDTAVAKFNDVVAKRASFVAKQLKAPPSK
jgi:hypothetical protein